jgi:hypothetical protein
VAIPEDAVKAKLPQEEEVAASFRDGLPLERPVLGCKPPEDKFSSYSATARYLLLLGWLIVTFGTSFFIRTWREPGMGLIFPELGVVVILSILAGCLYLFVGSAFLSFLGIPINRQLAEIPHPTARRQHHSSFLMRFLFVVVMLFGLLVLVAWFFKD